MKPKDSPTLDQLSAKEIIDRFQLQLLPGEGGFWAPLDRTEVASSIYFLTTEVDFSAWHKLSEQEHWIHIAGAPLKLHTFSDATLTSTELSRNLDNQQFSKVVKAGQWMAAESIGRWSLVICSLAPAFTKMQLMTELDFERLSIENSDLSKYKYLLATGE
jgi:predicted cupin superfamily sugar epimerase